MLKVLYVSCSSFSGSTLLSLLLNTHPDMATVGHSNGWPLATAEFPCSCGRKLGECPFWDYIEKSFKDKGLPFAYDDFGTRYELVSSERINRYLTAKLPLLSNGTLESCRDRLVGLFPGWAARLARTDRAYRTLIDATLSYHGAEVYVDNSHSPHTLRHLRRIQDIDLSVIHLVRDIRGNVYSRKKNSRSSTSDATRLWLSEQAEIARILEEFDKTMPVFYEELCERPDETLNAICKFVGADAHSFDGDFGTTEHHVLGNDMRINSRRITKNEAWREALSAEDYEEVERGVRDFVARHSASPVCELTRHYLGR